MLSELYRKPTADNSLLRADSGHPRHTSRTILRLCQICSDNIHFEKEAEAMLQRSESRGFSGLISQKSIEYIKYIKGKLFRVTVFPFSLLLIVWSLGKLKI